MATKKKRKLNRKVVIVFAVIGALLLGLGGAGLYRFRNRIWPKNSAACAKMGDEALRQGDFAEAVKNYKDAVGSARGRDKSDRLIKLSEIAYQWLVATPADQGSQQRERYGLFLTAMEEAKRESPTYIEPRKLLVSHWFVVVSSRSPADRPYSQFMNEADDLVKIAPDDHLTLYRRAIVNAMRSEADVQAYSRKALADFRKALALKKDSTEYWSRYVSYLQFLRAKQQVESEEIVQAFEEASRSIPDEPDFYVGLGNFKYRVLATDERLKERYKPQAIQLFKTAIAKSPASAIGYLALAEILINDGIKYKQQGLKERSAAAYGEAMIILADARKKTEELHRICHARAIVYEQQGEYAKGIDEYRQAITELKSRSATSRPTSQGTAGALSPEMVKGMTGEMYYRLGHALLNDAVRKEAKDRQAAIDEAATCLTEMRKLSKDATGVNLEVRLAILNNKADQAFRVLEETYRTNRNVLSFQNTLLLAELCMSRNIPTMAQDILKEMPDPVETEAAVQVLLLKARCRSMFNDLGGANALLEEVLKRDPANEIAPKMQAQLDTGRDRREAATKWREGQRNDAIRDMERVCQRRSDDVQAIRDLAEMYDAVGRRAELMALLEAAAKRMPNDKSIKMAYAVYSEADPALRKKVYLAELQTITDPFEKNIRLAEYYASNEEFDQAVACLEKAQAVKPTDLGILGQLFTIEARRGKYDAARQWATAMVKVDPEVGQTALGELAMTLRDADAAIEAFTKVLATRKQAKGVLVNRGRCLLIKEKYDQAEKDFQAAWNLDNRYLDAATGLARTAVAKKDMTAANKWVQTAIELPEGIRDKWVRTMAMQAKEARKDTTLQDLMQSREKILSVDPADADNRLRLGDLYMRANEPGKAEAQFGYVYGQFKEEKIQAAIKLAELYQSTRRPEKAKGILNELQQQTTDRPGAMLAYADYMLRTEGATPQCQQMIEEAIRLDDKDPRGYLELGQFYRAAEQWEKAIAAMDKVLSLGAKGVSAAVESDVRASQIECAIRSRQFDRAQKDIDALFARNKNDPMAFSLQSTLYQELGQAEKAKSVLDAALKIHTDSAGFYRSRGALHLRLGEMQEAQGDLAEARKLNPKDEAVGMTLGRVYERLRLYDKARAEYVGVMSQNPTNRDAYERLMQLYLRDRDWTKFSYMVEQARQAFPDEPKVLMQEGQMWLLRKEPEKGLAKMKQASDMPRGGEMDVLGTYLAALSSMGRYAEVLASTEKRAAQADSPAWIQAARATAVAKLNKPAEAEAMFVQAFKASTLAEASYIFQRARDAYGDAALAEKAQAWGQAAPKNWAWQFELGQFYSQKINATPKGPARDELISRGVAQIVKARDLADNDKTKADINFFLGMLLQLVDKPQEAEQAYLLVLKTSPRHLQANNNLAVLCTEELNRPKQAIQYAETIVKYHEIDANSMDTYGWALARAGEYEKALDMLTRAKVQDPEMPDIRYHLGWTLEKLNKKPEAQAEFKRGAEIVGPDKGNRLYEPLQAGLQRTK